MHKYLVEYNIEFGIFHFWGEEYLDLPAIFIYTNYIHL